MLALWGNKDDAPGPGTPAFSAAVKGFMEQNGIPDSLHFRVSAKTGHNVRAAFDAVVKALDDNVTCGRIVEEDTVKINKQRLGSRRKARSGCCK